MTVQAPDVTEDDRLLRLTRARLAQIAKRIEDLRGDMLFSDGCDREAREDEAREDEAREDEEREDEARGNEDVLLDDRALGLVATHHFLIALSQLDSAAQHIKLASCHAARGKVEPPNG